jgi:hypothetical protein
MNSWRSTSSKASRMARTIKQNQSQPSKPNWWSLVPEMTKQRFECQEAAPVVVRG